MAYNVLKLIHYGLGMKYSNMSPFALATLIGERIKRYRLNQNMSQEELSENSWVSKQKIARAENGQGTLETYMAILVALDATAHLDLFLPPIPISPIQLVKLQGKTRQRASKPHEDASHQKLEKDLGW